MMGRYCCSRLFNSRQIFRSFFPVMAIGVVVLTLLSPFQGTRAVGAEKEGRVSYEKVNEKEFSFFVDGVFFAQYRTDCSGTPVVWPICSDSGLLLSRGYPMDTAENLDQDATPEMKNIFRNSRLDSLTANKDHVHHRSLWFNHGDVNGVDFWGPDKGSILTRKVLGVTSDGRSVTIQTQNEWVPEEGKKPLCEDLRTVTFFTVPGHPEWRVIDYDIEVTALADSTVFADSKEGCFGYRVPGTMDVDATTRSKKWGGHILNNFGDQDEATWGKQASWVDYYGPVPKRLSDEEMDRLGETPDPEDLPLSSSGIVIMNHPKSFRYPSCYHVRTYGLFAVNPFGFREFEPEARLDGSVTLDEGDKLTFRYRVLFHDDPLSSEELNRLFDDYKAKP